MNSTILVTTDEHGNTDARPVRCGLFRRSNAPTPLQLAAAQLEAARCDLLEHTRRAEYHAAMKSMLAERIERLGRDIALLSAEPSKVKGDYVAGGYKP